jgi:hypothetical protein
MKRTVASYRQLIAAGVVLLLFGVVVLSCATRRPGLRVSSAPWHTYKAGHMTEPSPLEACIYRPAAGAKECMVPAVLPLPRYVRDAETLPAALPVVFQIFRFRSPPLPS